jgi:hypothetical protein
MTRHILFLLLLLLAVGGCQQPAGKQFEIVIRDYNKEAINAYRTGDTKPLRAFASEKESNKVQVLVDIKRNNGLILESELQKLEILESKKSSVDVWTVRTKERWSYHDQPMKAGQPPGKTIIADMVLVYTLQQGKAEWKVENVKAESTSYLGEAPKKM